MGAANSISYKPASSAPVSSDTTKIASEPRFDPRDARCAFTLLVADGTRRRSTVLPRIPKNETLARAVTKILEMRIHRERQITPEDSS